MTSSRLHSPSGACNGAFVLRTLELVPKLACSSAYPHFSGEMFLCLSFSVLSSSISARRSLLSDRSREEGSVQRVPNLSTWISRLALVLKNIYMRAWNPGCTWCLCRICKSGCTTRPKASEKTERDHRSSLCPSEKGDNLHGYKL